MTNEQIIAGNKLIAEFMGFKKSMTYNGDGLGHGRKYDFNIPNGFTLIKDTETTIESEWCVILMEQDRCMVEDLIFHDSWDWLMPVIEKIESLRYMNVIFSKTQYGEFSIEIAYEPPRLGNKTFFIKRKELTKIECCWIAIVEFLAWYNENKK